MAISVFTHSNQCIPPSTQVSLYYNGVNSSNTTKGDLGVYFTEDATIGLGDIINTPTQCSQGIDIVFIVDYTGSMSGAINGVKAGIANIINTISSESLNNARIGLVIFDEYTANATPNYGLKPTYTNLPAAQKFINVNSSVGKAQHITALAPMGAVNNFTDFNAKLALLNTSDFPLGNGQGTPEPGDLGTYEVVKNNLAGAWRAEAIKAVVLITDAIPGGNDDSNTSADLTYLNNILLPAVNARGAQVMVQSSQSASAGEFGSGNYYNQLANNSTIPGRYDQVTFDSGGNWINTGLIAGIQTLCDETYYATCDLASTGWYHRAGDCYNFYFDANLGKVTNIYTLPSTYDVTVNTTSTDENGRNIIWTVDTVCVSNGTTLYWTIGPSSTANSNDFINAISGGSFTINSNTGSFQLTTKSDNVTEGTEYIQVQIRTGSVSGPVITTSDFTLISDTSVSPTATPVPIVSYEHYSLQSDGNGYFNASLGCGELLQNPFYSLRNSVLGFQVGDQLWTNSSRTVLFNGNGYWYQVGDLFSSSAQKVIKIGEGQIMQIENCPTVTPTATERPVLITPTPTAVSSGSGSGTGTATCRNVWVKSTVDQSRYGLQWRNSSGNTTTTRFNQMLGVSMWYGGVEGVVYSVCSTLVPGVWDFNSAALVTLSGDLVVNFADGGVCTYDYDCFYITPTATPAATSQNCEEWTLYGGSDTGRSFTFTRCGDTEPITLVVSAGDSATECIVMPWNGATGAVRDFISCSGGPNPTPIATEAVYDYLMDPCDGVSPYVVARTNAPKSIGSVWDLTGSAYAETNPYTIIATSSAPVETTIAMGYISCEDAGGGGRCLLAGTMITLADGTQRAIETIVAGNELKSMVIGDMPDGDNYEVLKVWSQASPTVSNTTTIVQNNTMSNVDSVLSFNGGRLTSSKDHLHIIKRNNNWMVIKASTIVTGDIFIDESAQEIVINSIQELTGTFSVYKLDVETSDTYFANGIITHNSKLMP